MKKLWEKTEEINKSDYGRWGWDKQEQRYI